MVRAVLVFDTCCKKVYIVLYIGGAEVFRSVYRDSRPWQQRLLNCKSEIRLNSAALTCRVLTDEESRDNRSDWNSNLHTVGTRTSQAGQLLPALALGVAGTAAAATGFGLPAAKVLWGAAAVSAKASTAAPFIREAGRGMQAASGSFDFSRDVAEDRDFYFYYGSLRDGYGGIFCGVNKIFKG